MADYTEGEWKIYTDSRHVSERTPPEGRSTIWNIWIVDHNNKAIAQLHNDNKALLKANASLISAAPDMYEELVSAIELLRFHGYQDNRPVLKAKLKAIAKAKGKTLNEKG